jgi:hypothetical protein
MVTVESVLGSLQRPSCQKAPSWRVRITFKNGIEWEEMFEPDASWPMPLVSNPPARFIARQSMNLVRFYLREHGLEAVCLEIEPPNGTTDDQGRRTQTLLAVVNL